VGVGKPVPLDIVRRMFVLRINTLAKGRSGIRT
jgi:histidine ammonia-lyase